MEPGYSDAYDEARSWVDAINRLVRALDDRREEFGLSKAELARRAELAPEAVRRLFSVDRPNPTVGTLTALADALGCSCRSGARPAERLLDHRAAA
jgi:transcriptional regulator with XRE-family HTH domain